MKKITVFMFFLFYAPIICHAQTCNEVIRLVSSVPEINAYFGLSISIDNNTVVVGEPQPFYNDGLGAAYVSDYDGAVWSETSILTASDAGSEDWFGVSSDLDGDRLVIGAYRWDGVGANKENQGAVYVFDYDGTNWNETTILTASDGSIDDQFGWSVSIDGDRIIVGTLFHELPRHGAAYIYDYDGTNWNETVKLVDAHPETNDGFGYQTKVSGDRVIISGHRNYLDSVFVFEYDGVDWLQEDVIIPSDHIPNTFGFGESLDLDGDVIVVGAPLEETNGNDAGAIYHFEWDGSIWQETKILASDGTAGDLFGWSVAIDSTTIVAGARRSDDNGTHSGAAYNYSYNGSSWDETKMLSSDNSVADEFGINVDVSGENILIASYHNTVINQHDGSAYIFQCCDTLTTFYGDSDGDGFGEPNTTIQACYSPPSGYSSYDTDCDDTDPNIFPGSPESCDGQDNNCDGQIDEGFIQQTYYEDFDGDGFGNQNISIFGCPRPGYTNDNTDCDDSDPNNFPGNIEICDGQDNNCDGLIDEGLMQTYFADLDGDGSGDANNSLVDCSSPSGYVTDSTDCDDTDPNNFPGNAEVCDGQDNNCDGIVDEGCGPIPLCDSTNLIIPVLVQDTSRAEINLNSDALINSTNNILYTAGSSIDLTPPFEVSFGTIFEARIEPCDNN